MNRTMYDNTTLTKSVLQVAVLVTGTHLRAQYTIYGHEHWRKTQVYQPPKSPLSLPESAQRI